MTAGRNDDCCYAFRYCWGSAEPSSPVVSRIDAVALPIDVAPGGVAAGEIVSEHPNRVCYRWMTRDQEAPVPLVVYAPASLFL